MDEPERRGSCDCMSVRFDVIGPLRDVINCHCSRCRRFSGHHVAATCVDADRLILLSSDTLAWYEPVVGVSYGFCSRCGSSLFWKAATKRTISVMAGSLDQPTGLRTTAAWWVAEAGDYYERQAGLDEHPLDGE